MGNFPKNDLKLDFKSKSIFQIPSNAKVIQKGSEITNIS